ncbi:MAG: hypothetical protein QM500_01295 [Methylococcales bacterium]
MDIFLTIINTVLLAIFITLVFLQIQYETGFFNRQAIRERKHRKKVDLDLKILKHNTSATLQQTMRIIHKQEDKQALEYGFESLNEVLKKVVTSSAFQKFMEEQDKDNYAHACEYECAKCETKEAG